MSIENGVKSIFAGIGAEMARQADRAYAEAAASGGLEDAAKAAGDWNAADFESYYTHRADQVSEGLLRSAGIVDDRIVFAFQEYGFLRSALTRIFGAYEGTASCADKAGCVLRKHIHALRTDSEIVFDPGAKYTYMFPKKVLATHAEIDAFMDAARFLRHGFPGRYLTFMRRLEERFPEVTLR